MGDCLDLLKDLPDHSVDLVFCSPPYEDARLYGELNYRAKGQDWVDWCVPRFQECMRVCRGLVAWVVEGKTRQFRWSATPALLMADLHRAGVKLRKPPAYYRQGICGSGGPDWLRNDYEFTICASHGKLPWSRNTAMGSPCKYPPGGAMSYRHKDGQRRNARTGRRLDANRAEPKVEQFMANLGDRPKGAKLHTKRTASGMRTQCYTPPAIANPGNVIKVSVGKGNMGHGLCHENEAPFSEDYAEFFIRSFCPPGGTVMDCFAGSGTTSCVAKRWGRKSISIDIRESQRDIWGRRIVDPRYDPTGDHTPTQRS